MYTPSTERFELIVASLSHWLSKLITSPVPGAVVAGVTPLVQFVGLVVDQLLATDVLPPFGPTQ